MWIQQFAGHFSILSNSYFGEHFTRTFKGYLGVKFTNCILINHNSHTICYLKQEERDVFGKKLAEKFRKDKRLADVWCKDAERFAKEFIKVIAANMKKKLDKKSYLEFARCHYQYMPVHVCVKVIVDYLDKEELKKYLPKFTKARMFSEKAFEDAEFYVQKIAGEIASETGYSKEQVLSATKEEILVYFDKKALPNKKVLQMRHDRNAIIFKDGKYGLVSGSKVDGIIRLVTPKIKIIKGQCAYPGVVRGIARIINNPRNSTIKATEILVTSMTRPDFLPLMEKAAAFVTDSGGILSHAAITAREMKKPCIIGTQIATKKLNDGDLIEVDATKGIVKIIEKRK
jgi:phosphohistidine swiveling domain-containing protein